MEKLLISIPSHVALRLRKTIPARQRSKIIVRLITDEVTRREQDLYVCALAVEKDQALNKEMKAWDTTVKDGLEDETW